MIRCMILLISLFFFPHDDAYAVTSKQIFPLTMAGTRQAVTRWLQDNGYDYRVVPGADGLVRIRNMQNERELLVELRPHSPLATEVDIRLDDRGQGKEYFKKLLQYLSEKTSTQAIAAVNWQEPDIPSSIQKHIGTTVCIHSDNQAQDVQFSGVFINSRGLVLCTAHDLKKNGQVSILSASGSQYRGDIIKIDFHRDLALIQTNADQEPNISLEKGRNLLDMNEMVFSIGCPLNLGGTVSTGFIKGLPRRVDDLPMWQIGMEIQPGSSGSPVFDNNGDFVAIVKGRHRISSGIGFLTPLEVIIDFLNGQLEQ